MPAGGYARVSLRTADVDAENTNLTCCAILISVDSGAGLSEEITVVAVVVEMGGCSVRVVPIQISTIWVVDLAENATVIAAVLEPEGFKGDVVEIVEIFARWFPITADRHGVKWDT